MMTFDDDDHLVLRTIAATLSEDPSDQGRLLGRLIEGFRLHGSDEMVGAFSSRERFFTAHSLRLLENLPYAGQTSTEAFASVEGRRRLLQIVREAGAPESEVEDIAQEMTRKFWSSHYAERYNPLLASWRVFVSFPVKNYLRSYYSRRKKKVLNVSLSLDREVSDREGGTSDMIRNLYRPAGIEEDLDKSLYVKELMQDWEGFLSVQASLRSMVYHGFPKLATLMPPGIPEFPVQEETEVGYFNRGQRNSRVTTSALYDQGIFHMVPNSLLVDYISVHPRTGEPLTDPRTGGYLTQKFYVNPRYREGRNESIFRRMCVLPPPGTPDHPVAEEEPLYILAEFGGRYQVTVPAWQDPGRWFWVDFERLVPFVSMDEATRETLVDAETGSPLVQPFYTNPEYLEANVGYKMERRLIDVYFYLRDGYQADEIGRVFRAAASSVPSWVKRLEELFQNFWLISDRVPTHLKILAVRSYRCPECGKLARRWRESCSSCGADTTGEMARIRLDTYPWSRLHGTREILERHERARQTPLTVQTCSV